MTADELKSVEDFAGQFFTPQEVALILNISIEDLTEHISNKDSEFMRHYNRGVLLSKAIIRKGIIDMAKNGSGPAQVTAVKMMEEFELKRIPV